MLILVGALPLKLRARIAGELSQAEVVAVKDEEALLSILAQRPAAAVVLHESISKRPFLEFLAGFAASFAGLIVVVLKNPYRAQQLKEMVRGDRVAHIFHHPAPAEDIIRVLGLELGLRLRSSHAEVETEPLGEVWHESLPTINHWLDRLEAASLSPNPDGLFEARRAAHYLASNLGTFGYPRGTLLAREAEKLLQTAIEGGTLKSERLGRVVEALQHLTEGNPQQRECPRRKVIVIHDELEFQAQIDMEARLLQWETELCQDFADLPQKLSRPQARVVLVDPQAAACKRNREALDDLLRDPFPTVALSPPGQSPPPSSPSTLWLEQPVSAYSIMMSVLRSQLAPALDNPPCVLVVDDDRISLGVIRHALSQVDFHVEALLSPLDFWDRLEESRPDLIILDVELPNMSGIELCRAVRLDDRYARIPVLFLSSFADSKTVQKAFEAGADDYLYKPVVPSELRTRVSNRLERCNQRYYLSRAATRTGRTYTSLDQLMLRALREDIPLGLSLARHRGTPREWALFAQKLRSQLRGEDVIKPLDDQEILIATLSPNPRALRERLYGLLKGQADCGTSWFPEDGEELEALIQLARERVPRRE